MSMGPLHRVALLAAAAFVASAFMDPSSRELAGALLILAIVAVPLLVLLWELVRPEPTPKTKSPEKEGRCSYCPPDMVGVDAEEERLTHVRDIKEERLVEERLMHAREKPLVCDVREKTLMHEGPEKMMHSVPKPEKPNQGKAQGIRYTGRVCDLRARMRHQSKGEVRKGGEFDDDELFAAPPPPPECPLCCHAMPEGVWVWADNVSSEISQWQPCCGKKICCGCMFAVHFPEFKDHETFVRSLKPVFMVPVGAAKAAKSSSKKGGKTNKKKKGKGKNKGGKGEKGGKAQPNAKCCVPAPSSCAAAPSGRDAPPPSAEDGFRPFPTLESEERTIRLNLNGTLSYEATGTCPFCRSPELTNTQLVAALERHIKDGSPEAWFTKGVAHYRAAHGLKKSLKLARECWEKSVELGDHMMAHYALGMYHPRDEEDWKTLGFDEDMAGCQDFERARYHLTKAAMMGHPEARYNLAYYEMRDGGNLHRAFLHYRIAARQGYQPALKKCQELYDQGVGDVVPDYLECKKSSEAVHKEMRTEERKRAMRHRYLKENGVMKTNPLGSFCATMFGKAYDNANIMLNGNREFRFNKTRCQFEEVKNKDDFRMVGRLAADGRPLKGGR